MKTFFFFFFFFGEHLRFVSLVLGLGLEHSCPWPRECLSSERLSLALASDFFCVLGLGLGLEPCVLDSTSDNYVPICYPKLMYFFYCEVHGFSGIFHSFCHSINRRVSLYSNILRVGDFRY